MSNPFHTETTSGCIVVVSHVELRPFGGSIRWTVGCGGREVAQGYSYTTKFALQAARAVAKVHGDAMAEAAVILDEFVERYDMAREELS